MNSLLQSPIICIRSSCTLLLVRRQARRQQVWYHYGIPKVMSSPSPSSSTFSKMSTKQYDTTTRSFYSKRWIGKRRRDPRHGRHLPSLRSRIIQRLQEGNDINHGADAMMDQTAFHHQQHQNRSTMMQILDPWYDLATVTKDEHVLVDKVDSVTRTFGVVAALLASLSAALYSVELPSNTTSTKTTTKHQHQQQV